MTAPAIPAVPKTPGEWEEAVNTVLATPEKAEAAFKNGEFARLIGGYKDAYRNEVNATMADLKAQVVNDASASVLEMFKRNGIQADGRPDLRATDTSARHAAAYNDLAPGVASDKVWKNSGQMVQDMLLAKQNRISAEGRARLDKYEEMVNAFSPHIPNEGGFLIPEEFRTEIATRALEGAIVRPKAQVIPVPTGKFRWPVNDMTTEVGEVYGGIAFAWLDAGETFPEVEATFAALAMEAHKLGGLASVPNEMIRFAPALEAWLRQYLPLGIREFEDRAFINGNGADRPMGGLNAANPALIVAAAEVGQPADTITWVNVLAMFARMLPESYDTAEWDITPDAIPEIHTMALPVGTGGSAVMMGEGQGPSKLPMSILGIPIRYTRKAPALLGDQGDISLVDWSQYAVADTLGVTFDTSEHSSFRSDKTDFRILIYVDGQPAQLSPLTPQNNGPTLSSFVQLATR